MNINDLKYLISSEGKGTLKKYSSLNKEELHSLAFKLQKEGISHYAAILTLLKQRIKAKDKFSKSDRMFFTPLGFEQSTGEAIAAYTAKRFDKIGGKIIDLTCGIGGNSIFLAKENKVTAVENDLITLECAKQNAKAYGVENRIEFILGEAEENISEDAEAFFIDPARDRSGKTKTRSILNSRPNILELLPKIFKITRNVCVKISPAFDYKELALLPEQPEVEVISEDGVVKVVLLWFGDFKGCQRRATCLAGDKIYSLENNYSVAETTTLKKYLYEPDKAIIKAHLIDEAADKYGLCKIDQKSVFLTADDLINEGRDLFRIFRVIQQLKFSPKVIKKYLKENKIEKANIITRAFPVSVEDLYDQLKIKEGNDKYLLFISVNNKYFCLITERI